MHMKGCIEFICSLFLFISPIWAHASFSPEEGRILFLIQQGEHQQALNLYQAAAKQTGRHDFELLHKIGLALLDYGARQSDPEIQLLALFGASVSVHEDAYYILEEGLKSRYPQIQVVALKALAQLQHDQADQALLRAMGSDQLLVRFEAAHQLCLKKHPQAVNQTESLMYKTPKAVLPLYPPLLAAAGTPQAMRILRKFLLHSSEDVRLATILSLAKYQRDDLLPQIRQLALHSHFSQQEACAYALGLFKDEQSLTKLNKLASSQYPTVALAARQALYRLGQEEALQAIESAAQKGDIFAIAALGEMLDHAKALLPLLQHPDMQIRFNAIIALLHQRHPQAFEHIKEILIRDKRDLAFSPTHSPGKVFKAWKIIPSANQILQDDISAYEDHLELKESILEMIREQSEADFIRIAHQIFAAQQNDLVPLTAELLEDIGSLEAINCLKTYQQKLGAPLVRHYCNLTLYRLQEPGPYDDQLRQWVKNQSQTEFIRFQPFIPWKWNSQGYVLTPEETSQLLIKAYESLATNQDIPGIEALIEAIASGHSKNKYALAGLLLRATQ
ncbi:HEAT repeat domain-containing protein [Candidatus Protochlamydia phocaeensis]|uniref:HEAT repeat domain-containing protein n=1 Tax=Candidatus Protochlamydia phocaeensis TaxID=1414722 RepID=UPI0008384765|nr:HEAT repeat domain-containing protein [Candidatus Protochlamydia phocaeensis]